VAPALPTNIRLGWKGLPGTNVLAYYENYKLILKIFGELLEQWNNLHFTQITNSLQNIIKIPKI